MTPARLIEVTLNGRVLCTAGMDRDGVLMVTMQSEDGPGPDGGASARGTPAGEESALFVNGYTDADEDRRWASEKLRAGDKVRIRVLPSGAFDTPAEVVPPST